MDVTATMNQDAIKPHMQLHGGKGTLTCEKCGQPWLVGYFTDGGPDCPSFAEALTKTFERKPDCECHQQ